LPALPPSREEQTLLYRDAMARAKEAAPKATAPPSRAERMWERVSPVLAAASTVSPTAALTNVAGTAAAYGTRAYEALRESSANQPQLIAQAGEAAREKYGSDFGLQRVAELAKTAQSYVPYMEDKGETRAIRAPAGAAGVGQPRVSFPSSSAPRPGPEALKSVADFRRYVESAAEELAAAERIRGQLESKIAAPRSSETATEADRAKLADAVRKQNQYITDVRAGLVRAGMSDADIEALKMGEPPLPR
jgi:hypothetical protein